MSNSIERFKLDEKIRISFLRNACNIELVSKECNVPYEYALTVCNDYKKKMAKDPNIWASASLASYVVIGAEERKLKARQLLDEELAKKPNTVSICCGQPIKQHIWDNENRYVCEKCEEDCRVRTVDPRDKQLIIKLLKVLGEIDTTTVEAMEKLGIVGKTDAPLIQNKTTNYNLNVGSREKLGEEEQQILKKAGDLDGRSRQHLINQLEKQIKGQQIIDAKFEEKPKTNEA